MANYRKIPVVFLLFAAMGFVGCVDKKNSPLSSPNQEEEAIMAEPSIPPNANMAIEELSTRWRRESRAYVSALNAFIARGEREGWDDIKAGDEPQDTRQPLAAAVLQAIRIANEIGDVEGLHERFPRAHRPFLELLNENGVSLPVVMLLDDGRIVIKVGAPWEVGPVFVIDDKKISGLGPDVLTVGRSPDRNIFAIANAGGVSLRQGWDGPEIAMLRWPTGKEGIPNEFKVNENKRTPTVTRLIPFDSGDRVLLIGPDGIFVLKEDHSVRLLPTEEELREHFEWLQTEYPDDDLSYDLSMEHGAISPNGKWIAAGHQSSMHYVFDATTLEIVGEIGQKSEYPHFAAFNSDSSMLAFNSCHFYNGETIGVPTRLLPGVKTEPYEPDDRLIVLEEGSRVYAAVTRADEFIVGDASGYLRAFDFMGNARWQHFIGSSVGDIDISTDGKQLVVTTYAGFLSILDLDTGKADPFAIGTSTHNERRRWLFWRKEPKPLIW